MALPEEHLPNVFVGDDSGRRSEYLVTVDMIAVTVGVDQKCGLFAAYLLELA